MPEQQSPMKPWVPGTHPEYTAYRLVVNVCEDALGRVWSDHEFLNDTDAEVAVGTRNGGAEQVAHALLTEALRREAFVDILVRLSQDATLRDRLQQDPLLREQFRQEIEATVSKVVTDVLPKALPSLTRGVTDMMFSGR